MNISVTYKIYHRSCDFLTGSAWVSSNRLVRAQLYAKTDGWIAEDGRVLQRVRCRIRRRIKLWRDKVYYVLDCSGAGARREITRKPPPQVRFFTKFRTTTFYYDKVYSTPYIFFHLGDSGSSAPHVCPLQYCRR